MRLQRCWIMFLQSAVKIWLLEVTVEFNGCLTCQPYPLGCNPSSFPISFSKHHTHQTNATVITALDLMGLGRFCVFLFRGKHSCSQCCHLSFFTVYRVTKRSKLSDPHCKKPTLYRYSETQEPLSYRYKEARHPHPHISR